MFKFPHFFILTLFFFCPSLFSHEQVHSHDVINDEHEQSSIPQEEKSISESEKAKESKLNNPRDVATENIDSDASQSDKYRSHFVEDESSLHMLQSSFEEKKINEAIAARYKTEKKALKEENQKETPKEKEPNEASHLKISGLLFNSSNSWSIWIDGTIYNQHNFTFRKDLTLRALNAQTVELTDHGEKILLFVGQSYSLEEKKIVSSD